MNRIIFIIIILGLITALVMIFRSGGQELSGMAEKAVEVKNGVQYITIAAGGGYNPRRVEAEAGIPTKLILKTNGTYDCSSSIVIRSVGFQRVLPQTGETEVDLGIPKAGMPIDGVCSMGMYSFKIDFI